MLNPLASPLLYLWHVKAEVAGVLGGSLCTGAYLQTAWLLRLQIVVPCVVLLLYAFLFSCCSLQAPRTTWSLLVHLLMARQYNYLKLAIISYTGL
jgi:hypothetical protein